MKRRFMIRFLRVCMTKIRIKKETSKSCIRNVAATSSLFSSHGLIQSKSRSRLVLTQARRWQAIEDENWASFLSRFPTRPASSLNQDLIVSQTRFSTQKAASINPLRINDLQHTQNQATHPQERKNVLKRETQRVESAKSTRWNLQLNTLSLPFQRVAPQGGSRESWFCKDFWHFSWQEVSYLAFYAYLCLDDVSCWTHELKKEGRKRRWWWNVHCWLAWPCFAAR